MFPNHLATPTFYHHQATFHFRPPVAHGQPRVANTGSDRALIPSSKNFYVFRTSGFVLGALILFFTAALFSIELGRLYSGSNNRGQSNLTNSTEYLMYPNRIIDFNGTLSTFKVENRWMWPWSTATLLFSLIFFTTGILGIVSGRRESYSTILAFFISALFALFLLIFLIASYSTTIAGWRSLYGSNSMPHFVRLDRDLAIACLSMSCVLWLLQLISLIIAGRTIDACQRKDFLHGQNHDEHLAF